MEQEHTNNHLVLKILLLIIAGTPLIFFSTSTSMIRTWIVDEKFTHGFLIFPISIWLIWHKRDLLSNLNPRPESKVLLLLLIFLFGWFTGAIADVQLVQQLAMVSIIISLIWIILGRRIVKLLVFPLFFLYFAVPFGESLIPPMMDFTAYFTVFMLNLTGIPVFQDGLYFSLPSGNWSVVEACSGVRYLIASFSLGIIYAYLNYTSLKKRMIFIMFSILVPIIANGFRAYGIVMIGHLSNMELATGVDHLIYGWVFFGFVIFVLFWAGSKWWDPATSIEHELKIFNDNPAYQNEKYKQHIVLISLLSLFMVLSTLYFTKQINSRSEIISGDINFKLADSYSAWQVDNDFSLYWEPHIKNPDIEDSRHYRFADELVQLALGYYQNQRQGAEAVHNANRIAGPNSGDWKKTSVTDWQENELVVTETQIRNGTDKLLVWNWYRIGNIETPNKYIAKVLDVYNVIVTGREDATFISIATRLNENIEMSRNTLRNFWSDAGERVNEQLDELANESQ